MAVGGQNEVDKPAAGACFGVLRQTGGAGVVNDAGTWKTLRIN